MNLKQNVRIVGKQRWDMVSEDNGQRIIGAKLFVSDGQVLDQPDKVGEFPTTFNVAYEVFDMVKHVPGDYEISLSMKVGSKGQFSISGVRYAGTEQAGQK